MRLTSHCCLTVFAQSKAVNLSRTPPGEATTARLRGALEVPSVQIVVYSAAYSSRAFMQSP